MAVIGASDIDLTTEIGQVLASAGGNVDVNNALSYFKSAAKLNKWAKFKPVIYPSNFRSKGEYNTEDKRGGLTIKYVLLSDNSEFTQNAIRALYTDAENWSYNIPQGGSKQPYRLGDFRGYQTNSYPILCSFYSKDVINDVKREEGVFTLPFYAHLPSGTADSEGDGEAFDLSKNLQASDIDMYIEGSWFNLGDAFLACFVVKQDSNPIDNGFTNFDISSLRICEDSIADGGDSITIVDFVTGVDANTNSEIYWFVGGLVLKGATNIFLSMPFWSEEKYHSVAYKPYTPSYWMYIEVSGWSVYPSETVWHDVVWAQTEDYIAFPVRANSYLKIRVDVDLSGWSTNTFTFSSQNTRIYCSTNGITKYCSIYNESFAVESAAGVITDNGTLYLGADDLFVMEDLYDEYDIEIQVNTGNDNWQTFCYVGFKGSSSY